MMKMDGWRDHLHFAFLGEHVLLPNLHLDSFSKFTVASFLTVFVCLTERLITHAIAKHWGPARVRRSRFRNALWRAVLYWLVTFARLMYMLIAMTFSVGLIVITVTTLSFGQFIIEYLDSASHNHPPDTEDFKEPLLPTHNYLSGPSSPPSPPSYPPSAAAPQPAPRPHLYRPAQAESQSQNNYPYATRPHTRRTRSKPENLNLYIHPSESNIARADAAVHELGLYSSGSEIDYEDEDMQARAHEPGEGWEHGTGREVARELMGKY